MTARELANTVRPARETDSWASASIDERMQRDVNTNRVRETIVPYLAQHPDRFFGSFIVLVPPNTVRFEALSDIATNLPAAYDTSGMGFLTFGRGELIALDGQHRLVAFREVVTADRKLGQYAHEVGDDEVCVLVLEFETAQKTRRIFNKVNRHAKPTGRSDNIITSEDDGFAIVSRRLLDPDLEAPLAPVTEADGSQRELVTWVSTTLTKQTERLTTLSTVYEGVIAILDAAGFEGFSEKDSPTAPPDDVLERAYEHAAAWWSDLLQLAPFQKAIADPASVPPVRSDASHPHCLLLRPIAQVVLIRGVVEALVRSKGALPRSEALRRAVRLAWTATPDSMWRDTVVSASGKMISRKDASLLASDLLAYLIAAEWTTDEERQHLWEAWNTARGRDVFSSLDQLSEERMPEELPEPVVS